MSDLRKAAEQALEALDAYSWEQVDAARTALKAALAAAQGEAVVSDKAVKAALKAYSDWRYNDNHSRMRAALVAASNDDTPPAAPQPSAMSVVIERGRVWMRRGNQSWMLAYDDDEPHAVEWYAQTLRAALTEAPSTPASKWIACSEEKER